MAAGDLTDVNHLMRWLGVNAKTPLMDDLISAASAFFCTQADRNILSDEYTETYEWRGEGGIALLQSPVTAVQTVTMGRQVITAQTDPCGPGYTFDPDGVLYLNTGAFPGTTHRVTVSYVAGYASVPADVQRAVTEIAGYWMKAQDRIGVSGKAIGTESIQFSTMDIPNAADSTLRRYTRKF
jgi:hypothetical protein